MITGVWHGKIDKQKVEVKIIQNGDSLAGTSYYYESPTRYRRYTIKGYFDVNDNSVVWWDDQLIEDKTKEANLFGRNKPGLSKADFNCPGEGVMKLDGKTYDDENQQKPGGDVHLDKVGAPSFNDEWDNVIENYTLGANDPDTIDSISLVAKNPTIIENPVETTTDNNKKTVLVPSVKNEDPVKKEVVSVPVIKQENKVKTKITPPTIEQKFTSREKIFNKEIPLTGDSIELRFYDDAIVDGDSISLFLNGKLIFEHIRLTEKAYVVKLSVNDLQESNELTMVAENLGTIPPNTSYMVALVGDKRYDAQLASTENSSAMIRLKKEAHPNPPEGRE
ncbi:MAG: hypothetical protein ACHQF0_01095 [Chitinophagales bacterium]